MKKIILAIIVIMVGAIACAPAGPGYKGAADSGARLFISEYDSGGAITLPGDTQTWLFPTTVELTFQNEPINPSPIGDDPAITLLSYDVEFFSKDAHAVPLNPYYDLPMYVEVPAGGEGDITGLPVIFPETWVEYYTTADLSQSIDYRVKLTFHGQTEYGYHVKTFFNYIWIIGGP